MAEEVQRPDKPKDSNDLLKEGLLPSSPITGEPVRFDDSIPAPPIGMFDDADSSSEPRKEKKTNGSGGRKSDGRIFLMRPKFSRGDQAEMADKLAVVLAPDKSYLVHDEGRQYAYNQKTGAWEHVPDEILRAIVKGFAGCPKASKDGDVALHVNANATAGAVKLLSDETHSEAFFDRKVTGVAFKNGFVTCDQSGILKIEPNSAGNLARYAFDFDYDPDAPHPLLDSYLEGVFANCSEEERAARINLLQEAAGAAMFGLATTYQQAILLYGPGGCGKSQMADIMNSILPKSMCSTTPPHKWGERFEVASLVGILLNVVAELPASDLVNTEMFKSVITGDFVSAERKYHPPFRFRPRALHMFMANQLPATADLTDAFFRRFVICPFERNMRESPEHIEDIGAMIALAENPGIIAWGAAGAVRLRKQGRYTVPESGRLAMGKWRTVSDNVALFVEERCEKLAADLDIRDGTKASTLYGRYKDWAETGKFKPVSSKTFSTRMENLGLASKRQKDSFYYPVVSQMKGDAT